MKKLQGFVLLFTLMILMMISLFVVKAMEQTFLYSKAVHQQEKNYHAFYQLEQVAKQFMSDTVAKSCQAQQDEANFVVEQLINNSRHCVHQTKNYTYSYFLEDLGDYPCMVVFLKGRFYSTWHQRLSVLQKEKGHNKALLQIRFVKQGVLSECAANQRIKLSLDSMSWRYLNF